MADHESGVQIRGMDIVVIDQFAVEAGVTPQEFIEQSLYLGIDLAEVAVEALPDTYHILFQQASGLYEAYPLTFSRPEEREITVVPADLLDHELELEFMAADNEQMVHIEPELLLAAQSLAQHFGANVANFVDVSVFFRKEWGRTRAINGEILIDEGGANDQYLVLGRGYFDPPEINC